MSQYQNQPYSQHAYFNATISNRENKQNGPGYIDNQHLKTPPHHHKAKAHNLQQIREFIGNNPSTLHQTNIPIQMHQTNPQSNTLYDSFSPHLHQNEAFSSTLPKGSIQNPSTYYTRSQVYHQQSISQIYQQKKQEYINRIKRLDDHVEINYPDQGKYIGQIVNNEQKDIYHRQSRNAPQVSTMSRNGQGIFFYPTGDVYFGGWKDEMFNGQGVYIFSTGQIYDGLLRQSLKQGTGTYYYENCLAFYSGSWQNDLKNGAGLLNSPEEYYEGQWKSGIKHGNGYYKNKINRSIYVGEFYEGIKQGRGRMVYSDGSVYAGEFRSQLPHGVGDFQYPNKDKFIGQFIEGKKHGKGNYFFSQGTIFSGLWKDDAKIQGQLTLFNGDIFNGCFKDNQRYQGTYRYRNGDVYEGTWKDDVKEGFGKLYLQNGEKYQGKFIDGHKHGQGVYTWKNGDRYEGQFTYDKREGLGEYYWSDGGIYKGQWKADRMNGYGRLVKDGVDVIGQFFADHFQRPIEENQLGALRNFVLS